MNGISHNKENKSHVTYVIEPNLIEIGEYLFSLINDNMIMYLEYLIKTDKDADLLECLINYQNKRGQNAYDYAILNKKYEIANLLYSKIYEKQESRKMKRKKDISTCVTSPKILINIR